MEKRESQAHNIVNTEQHFKQLYVFFLPWNISLRIILMVHWLLFFPQYVSLVKSMKLSKTSGLLYSSNKYTSTSIHCNYDKWYDYDNEFHSLRELHSCENTKKYKHILLTTKQRLNKKKTLGIVLPFPSNFFYHTFVCKCFSNLLSSMLWHYTFFFTIPTKLLVSESESVSPNLILHLCTKVSMSPKVKILARSQIYAGQLKLRSFLFPPTTF